MTLTEKDRGEKLEAGRRIWRDRLTEVLSPDSADGQRWTTVGDILLVLSTMSSEENAVTMCFPDGDWGLHTHRSAETGDESIDLYVEGPHVVSPTALTFCRIDGDDLWSFFRLETKQGPFVLFCSACPHAMSLWPRKSKDSFGGRNELSKHSTMTAGDFRTHIANACARSRAK